jgi:hypothetical protein
MYTESQLPIYVTEVDIDTTGDAPAAVALPAVDLRQDLEPGPNRGLIRNGSQRSAMT